MQKNVVEFLQALKENNNRDWFNDHKMEYEAARKEVEQLVDFLIHEIGEFDSIFGNVTAKETLFRIYRDIRFSKDKTPYKTSMGSYIAPSGRKSMYAGYYLHIEPGNSFLAGGAYRPPADKLKLIRTEIVYNSRSFLQLIQSEDFIKNFDRLQGAQLKRPPVGFPADFEHMDLLKYKDFTVFHPVDDASLMLPGFPEKAIQLFKKMKPLNDFLNHAMELI